MNSKILLTNYFRYLFFLQISLPERLTVKIWRSDSQKEETIPHRNISASLITYYISHHGYSPPLQPPPMDTVGSHGLLLRGLLRGRAWRQTLPRHRRLVHLLLGLQFRRDSARHPGGAVRPSDQSSGFLEELPYHLRLLRRPTLPVRLHHLPPLLPQGLHRPEWNPRLPHRVNRLLLPGHHRLH